MNAHSGLIEVNSLHMHEATFVYFFGRNLTQKKTVPTQKRCYCTYIRYSTGGSGQAINGSLNLISDFLYSLFFTISSYPTSLIISEAVVTQLVNLLTKTLFTICNTPTLTLVFKRWIF